MKRGLVLGLAILVLAGCGAQPRAGLIGPRTTAPHALSKGPIVELPGMPVGQQQKLAGKYKTYKITGHGTVKTLTDQRLDVTARISAKVALITVTKDVTFAISRRIDATWPYQLTTVNLTDKETFENKAQVTSAANGITNFKLDDGTTAMLAADGQGSARLVALDFDLTFGKAVGAPERIGPPVFNPPQPIDIFAPR